MDSAGPLSQGATPPPSASRLPPPGGEGDVQRSVWTDALRAAALFAADPHSSGGIVLRAGSGPVRERWLDGLRAALPEGTPLRRMPAAIADDRLLGGLDLAATLRAGRPVTQSGLLAEADGGMIVVPMAERLSAGTVARLCAALDTGAVSVERDGMHGRHPARFGLVLLDEGAEDEPVAEALSDRLAFRVDLSAVGLREIGNATLRPRLSSQLPRPQVPASEGLEGRLQPAARRLRPSFEAAEAASQDQGLIGSQRGSANKPDGDAISTLCATAADLGIVSLRAPLLAARIARLVARLDGRAGLTEADLVEAARLVLAPRATRLPASDPSEAPEPRFEEGAGPAPNDSPMDGEAPESEAQSKNLDEIVLEAARAAIPPNLLAQLLAGGPRLRGGKAGRMGAAASAPRTGRPIGSRAGDPRRGRLDLIATLRAAAPWQRLRRRQVPYAVISGSPGIVVLPDDIRIKTLRQRTETTTIFCVDASGSAALERLAETKGAIELLLAESYVRRDRVALVAFRGAGAEVMLPPTRSLARAKRVLAGLPGGGGTPLAAGIDAAATLALGIRRGGGSPVIVLLTDGRANVSRSGEGGRVRAGEEALAAGRMLRAFGLPALLIDTGARPEGARRLADVAEARYVPLPHADAGAMSAAVRAATG
ncbi:magnesium chelatase subunit D [Methylobacterium brachythecii]|uniref:Magnesium chelatase subunit D n=2 Tax=Methylobacterium brachythecii TaxID=1176177 RepID=A0A7W6APT8_9HYPH|nr:magnesium chelatase subunit D [Methylobacterium brachythecii]MBB3905040.1 magnesium chelatase subunit D [Methylobacterium brachythecii]